LSLNVVIINQNIPFSRVYVNAAMEQSHKSFQTSKEFELSVGIMDQSRLVSDIKMSVYIL